MMYSIIVLLLNLFKLHAFTGYVGVFLSSVGLSLLANSALSRRGASLKK